MVKLRKTKKMKINSKHNFQASKILKCSIFLIQKIKLSFGNISTNITSLTETKTEFCCLSPTSTKITKPTSSWMKVYANRQSESERDYFK